MAAGGIFSTIIGPALDGVSKLIDQFHLSPEEKAQAQAQIADAAQKATQAAQDYDVQLNKIAGDNIRAESTSTDKFVERARPSVIYAGIILMLWNWALAPVALVHYRFQPVNVPDAFWWTWGTIVTGYVFSRSTEKIAQIPGDSSVNVLGMLKVGNKSAV